MALLEYNVGIPSSARGILYPYFVRLTMYVQRYYYITSKVGLPSHVLYFRCTCREDSAISDTGGTSTPGRYLPDWFPIGHFSMLATIHIS